MTVKKVPSKSVAAIKRTTSAAVKQDQQNELTRKAFELRKAGKSWWQIAEELKITERQAGMLVSDAIKEAATLVDERFKKSLLAMEVDRLDALQYAVWQDAIAGDRQAVETALRIIQARAKVLGLDNMPTSSITNNTIVVSGTSEEYIAALRKVSEIPIIEHEE